MQAYSAVPTFEEWKRLDSVSSRILNLNIWKLSNAIPSDAPIEHGNIIDYLRFLASILEAGKSIPDEVLDALEPEVAYLLLTHFAPTGSLDSYSPTRFRLGRA